MGTGRSEELSNLFMVQRADDDGAGLQGAVLLLRIQAVCPLEFQRGIKGEAGDHRDSVSEETLGIRSL
ncbi:hypothetical protein NDU88_001596 [Pleurodeles waltl]|uniref:Uncharacterized protein n=1 Tax=Pleurodeles waltl TaxID=8319 RepID=A0AAV7Q465_PLEWA|nr:hypothetical protein NDU88_001596 [Pleurodeles waltl]